VREPSLACAIASAGVPALWLFLGGIPGGDDRQSRGALVAVGGGKGTVDSPARAASVDASQQDEPQFLPRLALAVVVDGPGVRGSGVREKAVRALEGHAALPSRKFETPRLASFEGRR
jgi:hypothetical protein